MTLRMQRDSCEQRNGRSSPANVLVNPAQEGYNDHVRGKSFGLS
jgi:hypothetical protein